MLTLEEARRILALAVEKQGRDFVYNPEGGLCCYVPQKSLPEDDPRSQTGCIVGTGFDLGNIKPPRGFPDWEHAALELAVFSVSDLNRKFAFLTDDAETYLQIAQMVQDGGGSWGVAFDAAERAFLC